MTQSEKKFKRWCKDIFHIRLYDAKTGNMAKQYADFLVYYNGTLFLFEVKETQTNTIHKSRLYQMPRLEEVQNKHNGVVGYFILQYPGGTFALTLQQVRHNFKDAEKSIHYEYAKMLGVRLDRKEDLMMLLLKISMIPR